MGARRDRMPGAKRTFSAEIEEWLNSRGTKTIQGLLHAFQEKSFAILCLLLMSIPALPLPTGGVTHVFEIIVMLLALEMIIGWRTPWLPKRALRHELGPATQKKAIPFIVRRVRWFEKHSRHRVSGLLRNRLTSSVLGFVILGLALTSFLSPPFSGLDTIPSLGLVILSLGLILEDALLVFVGMVVGAAGVALVIAIGSAAAHFLF